MRKRLMSFLLILAMIMGMLPTSVMADEHEGQIMSLWKIPPLLLKMQKAWV